MVRNNKIWSTIRPEEGKTVEIALLGGGKSSTSNTDKVSHPYHLVNFSPWPLMVSISIFIVLFSAVLSFHGKTKGKILYWWGTTILVLSVLCWLIEVNNEASYRGDHTDKVKSLLFYGFVLFVISESSLFTGLFIALFYNALAPSAELGSNWPPLGINILNPQSTPLFNTAILFSSGFTVTLVQSYITLRYIDSAFIFLVVTILYGSLFSYLQYMEYSLASFSISDSIYGTTFYMLTGFHGIHVLLGTILLIAALIRMGSYLYTYTKPIYLNISSLYWHFVDYVWLALYLVLYCWVI